MISVKPVVRVNMAQKASELIQEYIDKNKLQAGDRLPAEKELSSMLNLGTRTIREALKMLQARGFLEIHQGKGIFVTSQWLHVYIRTLTDSLKLDNNDIDLLIQLMDVRKLIEAAIVKQIAAVNIAPKRLEALEKNLVNQKRACDNADHELFNSLDVEFHCLLVDCAENTILSILYKGLIDLLFASFKYTLNLQFIDQSFLLHKRIYTAISQKKPQLAYKLIIQMIEASAKKLKKSIK
jgi:DNA-binding FadR family transcriptional regulator